MPKPLVSFSLLYEYRQVVLRSVVTVMAVVVSTTAGEHEDNRDSWFGVVVTRPSVIWQFR